MATRKNYLISVSKSFAYLNDLNLCDEITLLGGLQLAFLFKIEFTKKPAPRISFIVKDCRVNFFETKEELAKDLKKIGIDTRSKETSLYNRLESNYYNVYWKNISRGNDIIDSGKDVIVEFAKKVDYILENSLHFQNILHDYIKELSLDFEQFLDAENAKRSMVLAKYIEKYISPFFCCIINLSPTDSGISKFVKINVLKGGKINRICSVLSISKNDTKADAISGCYKSEINSYELLKFLTDCAVRGKSLLKRYHQQYHVLFMPVVRKTVFSHYDGNILSRELLLICKKSGFSNVEYKIVSDLNRQFINYLYSKQRLAAINLMDDAVVDAYNNVKISPPTTQSEIDSKIKDQIKPALDFVLYTTDAYSASLRIYDQSTQGLKTLVRSCDEDGGYSCDNFSTIKLKGHKYKSVNVFTFLNGGDIPYVYLPLISKKGQLQIPVEYRKKGLQTNLAYRKHTKSELCFPLMSSRICFGTLNFEAPSVHAFDGDIEYLKIFKKSIELICNAYAAISDFNWVTSQVDVSASIHELYQHLDVGSVFSHEQKDLLRNLFPKNSLSQGPVSALSCSAYGLRIEIYNWIKRTYLHRTSIQFVNKVFKIIKFKFLDFSMPLKNKFYIGVFIILKNLIQNSVSHGDLDKDVIILDDQKYFMLGPGGTLRIIYLSKNHVNKNILDKLCISPVDNKRGERRHGMFLVGLIVKVLNGTTSIDRDSTKPGFSMLIKVPYMEERNDQD